MIMSLFWLCGILLIVLVFKYQVSDMKVAETIHNCPYQTDHRSVLEGWAQDQYPNTPKSYFKKMAKGDLIGLWYTRPHSDILPQKIYNKE